MSSPIVRHRSHSWDLLSEVVESLELPKSKKELAEERYNAVAKVLVESGQPLLKHAKIYPQGSFRIGTTVKPVARDEFDLDFVCHIPVDSSSYSSKYIYDLVGKVLSENGTYKKMLEPKKRCWRINYAGDFHMDITPSTIDASHYGNGEMVPDRELAIWKESNPIGFANMVNTADELAPNFSSMLFDSIMTKSESSNIEELPDGEKKILKRFLQIIKRSRDTYFYNHVWSEFSPISVLLTTIVTKAYIHCVERKTYDDVLEVFEDVLHVMPDFIKQYEVSGKTYYMVENPTHTKENFSEKWNKDERYHKAFIVWRINLLQNISELRKLGESGLDMYANSMQKILGDKPVKRIIEAKAKSMFDKKSSGALGILSGTGVVADNAQAVTPRPNTFFGA
jgi:hypothetical protein